MPFLPSRQSQKDCRIFHCRRGDVDREVSLDAPEAVEGKTRICGAAWTQEQCWGRGANSVRLLN